MKRQKVSLSLVIIYTLCALISGADALVEYNSSINIGTAIDWKEIIFSIICCILWTNLALMSFHQFKKQYWDEHQEEKDVVDNYEEKV